MICSVFIFFFPCSSSGENESGDHCKSIPKTFARIRGIFALSSSTRFMSDQTNQPTTAAHYIIYFLPDQTLSNSSSPIFTAFEKQFYLPVVYNSCICLFENIQPVPLWRQHEMSLTQKFANIHITLTQTPSSRTMNSGTTHRQGSWDHQSCCCLKELCLKGAGINTKHGGILIHFVSTALSLFFTSLFF